MWGRNTFSCMSVLRMSWNILRLSRTRMLSTAQDKMTSFLQVGSPVVEVLNI